MLVVGLNYAPESTGIAPYTSGLAEELARRGWRTAVVSTFEHYPQWSFGPSRPGREQRTSLAGVVLTRVRHVLPLSPTGLSRVFSELSFGFAASARRWPRVDVVVLVSPALIASAVALLRARLLTRTPVVIWVQDLYSLGVRELGGGKSSPFTKVIAQIEGWCLRRADGVVVIHERFRDTVVEALGVKPDAVTVVRNWSHLEAGRFVDRSAVRRRLGWALDDFIVLHAGNMGVKQGLENVVKSARAATLAGSRVRFVLVGDGNQRKHLEALATEVPALSMYTSMPDDEFLDTLNAADVLLVNERGGVAGMAVPSKLTSYFSTGLPVIAATDARSVTASEVLLAEAGVVVAPDDPDALLLAAESLAADPARARKLGANGLRFRSTRLTPIASFDRFVKLLRGLAARRNPLATKESGNG